MLPRPVSQVTPRSIAWLWPYRLATGKLAMLDGDPGVGKSLFTLDLCARLSTGRDFPDGSPGPEPCNTLVISGEDLADDTIRPRLQSLDADLERIFILDPDDLADDWIYVPRRLRALEDAMGHTKPRLVILDPIVAFLDASVVTHSDQSVRSALASLARLARSYEAAMLLPRHLNKDRGRRALYRGGGSIGFLAACRSGWLLAEDPTEPSRRVLAQLKNNLAKPQPSLAFTVTAVRSQESGVRSRESEAEVIGRSQNDCSSPGEAPTDLALTWEGVSPWTAEQLLAKRGEQAPQLTPRQRAREFLEALLEDGPRTARDVWSASQEAGFSDRTIKRAKEELGIRSHRCPGGRAENLWLFPGQELPDMSNDLEPWLAPLRERFPPSTPLDEL